MGFLDRMAKILFGSLAEAGKKTGELKIDPSSVSVRRVRKQGINPLVRNCDEYDEADYKADCGSYGKKSGAVCLARDLAEN